MDCTSHLSIEEMLRVFAEARQRPKGSLERVRMLMKLVDDCPSFAPALVDLGRQIQLLEGPERTVRGWPSLDDAGGHLATAVAVSSRAVEPLVEWAYFVDVVQDNAQDAEPLFEEAVNRARDELEQAWTGLIKVYLERDKIAEAEKAADRAAMVFPESDNLRDLVEQTRIKRNQGS